MRLSRRRFLGGVGALTVPVRVSVAEDTPDGFQVITARAANLSLLEGDTGATAAWIFGDAPGAPVIRVKQGQEARLRFVNELDHDIWLSFFGVRGPAEMMTIQVMSGGSPTDVAFTPPDAGTFWIGPMSEVSRHRDMGLTAMLIVEEAQPLPGVADLPLIFDDWIIDEGGAIAGGFGDIEAMVGEGRLGNWFTVNNRFRPKLTFEVSPFTRLRLLNTANIRTMGLLFKGADPRLVARDGHPVPPQSIASAPLFLAPGQRADVLVANDAPVVLALDLFEDVTEIAYLEPGKAATPQDAAISFALPANPVPVPDVAALPRSVELRLEGGIKGGLKGARYGGRDVDLRGLLQAGKGWAINGVVGPPLEPAFTVRQGETVVLDIHNATAFSQAFAILGHAWTPTTGEISLRQPSDTAVIAPGQRAAFAFVASNSGTWAIQSLVAERYDGGLLTMFSVEAEISGQ